MNKELSLLTLKTESRDRLYFDQWEYAFSFYLKEAHTLKTRDADTLAQKIAMRIGWAHWQQRYTTSVVANLETSLSYINSISQPFKLVVAGNWATIYTNHANLANEFVAACSFVSRTRIRQAVVDRPRDTVLLTNPTHSFRSYFKAQWFPNHKLQPLCDFFAAQAGEIVPCGAFGRFLNKRGNARVGTAADHWLPDYYYVEYSDTRYATMMALMMPRCFRKTMTVAPRINS